MTEQENQTLNELALKFSQTRNQDYFWDLVQMMRPTIQREARKWGRVYQRGDSDDFESEFMEAAHIAAKWYDGRSDYIQSFYYWVKRRGAKWKDKLKARKREIDYSCESLFQEIGVNDNGESETLMDIIPSGENTEETVILNEMAASFGETNRQYAKVIELYMEGASNEEMALSMGAESYSPSVRKKVQRAKESFKKYISLPA